MFINKLLRSGKYTQADSLEPVTYLATSKKIQSELSAQPSPKSKGHLIEKLVANWLVTQGCKIVQLNYRIQAGEIDIIAKDNATLIFIEIKHRKNDRFGGGMAAITAKKQHKIRMAAESYLQQSFKHSLPDCRFDVICTTGAFLELHWIKNAF